MAGQQGQRALKPLPKGVQAGSVERLGDTQLRVSLKLAGDARPSERTDFVFVVDVSCTMQEMIDNGELAEYVWGLLQHVSQFDDDGIDFYLASTISLTGSGAAQVLDALQSGRAPTDAETAAAHGCTSVGQCTTLEDVKRVLIVDGAASGLAGVLAPALQAARAKRKPDGRLFIEVVTDARIVDDDAFINQIASMSQECRDGRDEARFRLHVLGVGDVDTDRLKHWDSGLGDIAPIDIVATSLALKNKDIGAEIFKEMKSFLSSGEAGLIEVKGTGVAQVTVGNTAADDGGDGSFLASLEQVPLELVIDVTFKGRPSSFLIDLSLGGLDPISVSVPVGE